MSDKDKIQCGHFVDASNRVAKCGLGLFGGSPSHGVCLRVCEQGPKLEQLTVAEITHGAIGLAKAAVRVDQAAKDQVAARLEVCKACDRATIDDKGRLRSCSVCKCALWAKLSLASESCPLGKW